MLDLALNISENIKVNVWTVDDKILAERLIEIGVDFITSNILL